MTMLVTWLIEIFLNQLGEMKEAEQEEDRSQYNQVQEEFRQFLANTKIKVKGEGGVVQITV